MAPELPLVLLSKSSFKDGSRNALAPLFQAAQYERVADGDCDSTDEVIEGGLRFRFVKGPDALACQLELCRDQAVLVIMGSDILQEALLTCEQNEVRSEVERLLTLAIGQCRLRVLAPNEDRVEEPSDLEGRMLFTKFPRLLESLLNRLGVQNQEIRETDGADTRVNEWRSTGKSVGAFELVQSGSTAKANNLQIADNEIDYPPEYDIQTDVFLIKRERITTEAREAFRSLGLALESARESNRYVTFTFNVPRERVKAFRGLGMKGPTIAKVLTQPPYKGWFALEISVPVSERNQMRVELIKRGAEDILCSEAMNAEPDPECSEVLRALPFDESVDKTSKPSLASILSELEQTIQQRAQDAGSESYTKRLLDKGLLTTGSDQLLRQIDALVRQGKTDGTFGGIGAKVVEETLELIQSFLRQEGRERSISEAADFLYHFVVLMISQGITLQEIAEELESRRK